MPLGSTFVPTLLTPSHPDPIPGTPCPGGGGGGTSGASRVPRTAAVWGWGGGLPRAFSLVTSSPVGTGAIWKAKTPSLKEWRAQPPPYFRCWEMLPTHSTPPLDSCPHSGSGSLVGGHGEPSLGNAVVWIILQGPDPAPLQRKFCLLPKGPYSSSQKFLTLIRRYPPTPLTGFQRKSGPRSGQERRRGGRSRVLRT